MIHSRSFLFQLLHQCSYSPHPACVCGRQKGPYKITKQCFFELIAEARLSELSELHQCLHKCSHVRLTQQLR